MRYSYKITTFILSIITIISFIGYLNAAGLTVPANHKVDVNASDYEVAGDITVAGTLQITTGSIELDGSWTNTGTFNAGSESRVEFTGSPDSTIKGDNTFADFKCTEAGKTLIFEAGKTQTISDKLTLKGSSGNPILLRSTVVGSQWNVNPATTDISFVDVQDSNNLSATVIDPASSTDSGNNTKWFSGAAVTTTTTTLGATTTTISGATTTTILSATTTTLTTTSTTTTLASTTLTAAFNADPIAGFPPLEVQFTDISTGNPTSWTWVFGDGDTSSEQNPAKTYNIVGNFTVRLTVSDGSGSVTVEKTIIVLDITDCAAAFKANKTTGIAPLEVQFTDISTGNPTSWAWVFGDGDISSDQNPIHTYKKEGFFAVKLTVSTDCGSKTVTQTNLIFVSPGIPVPRAEFSASPLTGFPPLKVQFTDASTGDVANWSWNFGDGVISGLQNPGHEYLNPGFYNVKLIVSNESGAGLENKINLITILEGEGPTAAFLAEPLTGNAPFTVHFFDTSSGEIANHTWEFGDGDTSSEQSPVHKYETTGSFNVKLTVSGKNGTGSENKTGLIEVTEGKTPTAGFTKDESEVIGDQLSVQFTDLSSSPNDDIISHEWDFGDGAPKSEDKEPVHTYTGKEGDTFTVRLTVQNADGFDTVTKPSFVIIAPSIVPGFVKGRITDKETGDDVEGVECCITKSGTKIACAETTNDGLYFIQVEAGKYVFTAAKDGFSEFSKNIDVIESDTQTVNVKLGTGSAKSKSFTFDCEQGMTRGAIFGLEKLTMNVGDTENCTLRLTNHEPGKTVEVSSLLRNWFRSAIKIEPARSVTDENGELKITITAISNGTDWAAWAVPNEQGRFRFNKKTYDSGLAWGMLVKVR
ncbi:MAG: PKD domain-containing protein [Candidatus Anammoxibacter sp.]